MKFFLFWFISFALYCFYSYAVGGKESVRIGALLIFGLLCLYMVITHIINKYFDWRRGKPAPNIDDRTKIEKILGRFGFGIISLIISLFLLVGLIGFILVGLVGVKPRVIMELFPMIFVLAFFVCPFVMLGLRKVFENIEQK